MSAQEYRHIVRIVGKDIAGEKKLLVGLTDIKGVGYNFANAIIGMLNLNPNSNIGFLSEDDVNTIEKALKDLVTAKFPDWMLNRRKDLETGKTFHLLTSDVAFTVRNDIEREKQTNSWRGFRHTFGLKVRGQRTRTTGRKGASVGVRKGGKVLPAAAPAEAAAAAPAAPGAAATAAAPAAAPAKGAADTKAKPSTPDAKAKK